jgi:hypothetical protein
MVPRLYAEALPTGLLRAVNAKEVSAEDFEHDINQRGDGVVIKNYKGLATIVNIPAAVEGFPVMELVSTEISRYSGKGILQGNKDVISVTIPDSVTVIDQWAFNDCLDLQIINLPRNMKTIELVMNNCPLTTITIPNGVTKLSLNNSFTLMSLRDAGMGSKVKTLALPVSITDLYLFDFASMESIELPAALTKVDIGQCPGLKNIILPAGVKEVNLGYRINLKNVFLPAGVTKVRFPGCSSLESIALPDRIAELGEMAFRNRAVLTSVTLPKNLKIIGGFGTANYNSFGGEEYHFYQPDGTFEGCVSLTSITIPGNLDILGSNTFKGCVSLEKITINGSVDKMGTMVFSGLPALKEIEINGNIKQVLVYYQTEPDGEDYERDGIYYEREVKGTMSYHPVLEKNLFSFKDCPSLTTVTIGPNVTSLPKILIDELLALPNLTLASRAALRRLSQ